MARNNENRTNRHHRRPKARGGSGVLKSGNIVIVPIKKHFAWHLLFGIQPPPDTAQKMNSTWIDPDWIMVAVPQKDIIERCGNIAQCTYCRTKFSFQEQGASDLVYQKGVHQNIQQINLTLLLFCSNDCLQKYKQKK